MSTFLRAGRVHAQMVQLISDMIEDSDRTLTSAAVEAGIPPSRLQAIVSRRVEVLTVPDVAALGQVLGFKASDLTRLAERHADAVAAR